MRTACILRTSGPVEFSGDEFVEACPVDEVQVIWPGQQDQADGYVGKTVRLRGELFGEHTAHHRRKVVLLVDGVDEVKR